MAPFHPLRYETRAFVARALAAFAVFCAIAFALLMGTGAQIASAEADKDKGAADGTGVVLQDSQTVQPTGNGNGTGTGNGHNGHHHGPPGLTNGHPAPAIRLPDLDGDLVEADLRGGLTVLLFWNPGCGFCQQMLPALRTWADERSADAPSLLVIAAGSAEDNRAQGLAATVLLDADFSTAHEFGATGTPQAVLVGPDGGIASPLARGADAVARLLDARLAPT